MGMPPLPPQVGAQAGMGAQIQGGQQPGQPPMPSMMQLAGMGAGQGMQQGMAGQPGQSPGLSEISSAAVRMGAEIDQALKLLAQSIPTLAPWVEKTCLELRYQIGSALNSGAAPTNPTPNDNQSFPDGGGRL